MTVPPDGTTPRKHPAAIRDVMPCCDLHADPLAAMFASVPAPPPNAAAAWWQEGAMRMVREIAGPVPGHAMVLPDQRCSTWPIRSTPRVTGIAALPARLPHRRATVWPAGSPARGEVGP